MDEIQPCTCGSEAYPDTFLNRERRVEHFIRCRNPECPSPIGPIAWTEQDATLLWNRAAAERLQPMSSTARTGVSAAPDAA